MTADFMKFTPSNDEKYGLLLCSQVLEHVPDPAAFMKKMIITAKLPSYPCRINGTPAGKIVSTSQIR